jgi:inhibitor of KinA
MCILLLKEWLIDSPSAAFLYIEQLLKTAIATCDFEKTPPGKLIEIPVCYDAIFALDIQTVATEKNISTQDIIEMHSNQIYRVYMIGFMPGFAYMGILNENLFTERIAQSRAVVPAGGWSIIGKTNWALFNAEKKKPSFINGGR